MRDAAILAKDEDPRFISVIGHRIDSPGSDMWGKHSTWQVTLDLLGIVIDLHVDEVSLVAVCVLQINNRVNLRSACGASTERG